MRPETTVTVSTRSSQVAAQANCGGGVLGIGDALRGGPAKRNRVDLER